MVCLTRGHTSQLCSSFAHARNKTTSYTGYLFVTLYTTWKLVTCACGGRSRRDGGCWWRWATWLDKQLPFGHIDGLNWQNGAPGNELKGNLGEKLGGGNGGLLKIEKAPWASVGHDGKPFALKDGGKFPKFGGGSCDISSVENTTHWKRVGQSARARSKRYLLGAECFVAMCMLFSEKSDQLRIIFGSCRIPLRLVRSLSQGPLGFQYGGRGFFKSRPVSQRFGHPRVLGIPISISLAFWASPVGDAQNADRFDFA